MASDQEPAKALLPYLQRADELQKHEPIVAYYCRLYAMDRGLKIPASNRTKTTNSLLNSLIKQLEKDKKSLNLGPEDNLYLEGFALNLFGKADKQDRAGRADLNTAKTFYAASIFFEVLNQFGPVRPDLEQKRKYAAWKAVDIRKALKEGRQPIPGPPLDDEDLFLPSTSPSGSYGVDPSEAGSVHPGSEIDLPSPTQKIERQYSADISQSPSSHTSNYPPPQDFQPPSYSVPKPVSPSYPTSYSHEPYPTNTQNLPQDYTPDTHQHQLHGYPQEHLPQMPRHYPSEQQHIPGHFSDSQQYISSDILPQNNTIHSYPHFQSYPSFAAASVPSVSSQHPSYYQGPDSSHPSSGHLGRSFSTATRHDTGRSNGGATEASPRAETHHYDSNYQPPPEKIAEAHKAARFAVGALAFDDVSVAVDFLRKSLELLTNQSAGK
ncbi:hypothetical protein MLD38_024909 [Melastoma candidum]|uniref:Uncharacterized protein n=1 Tax=Melastoma candidum TaxID=119954 RepID=A0ACB9NTF6_9MYRT|nr:hypothetical protein MLD38_024909 [Melastoma candidum]